MSSDGPSITARSAQYYALLGSRLSLVCGTGLDSNPPASTTWIAPDGTMIVNNARYDLENGPDVVRLNISHTRLDDAGMWICDIRVLSERYIVNNGHLVLQNSTVIGVPHVNDIHLTIICKLMKLII